MGACLYKSEVDIT